MDMELGSAFMAPQLQMQQIEASRAQQQYHQAQTAQTQYALEQEKRMGQMMGEIGAGTGAPQDIPSMLDQIAQRAMGAGMVEQAGKIAAQSAQIRERKANEQQNIALTAKQENEGLLKAIELSREVLFNVRSQDDLDRANALWTARTGTMSPLSGELYSPKLLQEFQDEMLAAKGQATSRDRAATQALRQSEADSRKDMREAVFGLRKDAAARREREDIAKAKTGGRGVNTPAAVEIEQASTLIRKKYESFKGDKDLLKQAAFDVASEAKAIRTANPGISAGEALQQAFAKAETSGDFQEADKWLGLSKEPVYKAPKPAAPQGTLPPAEQRVVGKTTFSKDGKTYVWTESGGQRGWAPAQGGK